MKLFVNPAQKFTQIATCVTHKVNAFIPLLAIKIVLITMKKKIVVLNNVGSLIQV